MCLDSFGLSEPILPPGDFHVNKTLGPCATQKNSGELCLLLAEFSFFLCTAIDVTVRVDATP
jgi:hypothetical protein